MRACCWHVYVVIEAHVHSAVKHDILSSHGDKYATSSDIFNQMKTNVKAGDMWVYTAISLAHLVQHQAGLP